MPRAIFQVASEFVLGQYNVVAVLREHDRAPLNTDEITHLMAHGHKTLVPRSKLPGGISEARVNHNVLVNQGRHWLRNSIVSSSYPATHGNESLDQTYSVVPTPTTAAVDKKIYRVRYMGVGIGGALQGQAGIAVGTFVEDVSRVGLERPWTILGTGAGTAEWLQEVLPHGNLGDSDLFPDAYTARFRAVLGETEVSYTGSHDHNGVNAGTSGGTVVPISEAILCTSEANPVTIPVEDGISAVPGVAFYDNFVNLNKTPKLTLELVWDVMF